MKLLLLLLFLAANAHAQVLTLGDGNIRANTEGVTEFQFTKSGYTSTPVSVGMLGGPEANFTFNFGYNGSWHWLYDESKPAWSWTMGPAGVTLQYIPAGPNPTDAPDAWHSRGRSPMFIDGNGNLTMTGRGTFGLVGDHIRLKVDGSNDKDGSINASVDGVIRIGPWSGGGIKVTGQGLRLAESRSPASSDACVIGDLAWDSGYVYVCVADSTWKRSALVSY